MKNFKNIFSEFIAPKHSDRDFLPAALEIIETPPSPIAVNIFIVLVGTLIISIIWSMVGQIDIIATAQGKIQPRGSVKVIQSIETGKIRTITVNNGSVVKKDDILIQIDDADAKAEYDTIFLSLAAYRAEAFRREAAIKSLNQNFFFIDTLQWPAGIPEYIKRREDSVLRNDIAQLNATVQSYRSQIGQKKAEINKFQKVLEEQERQITISRERVELRDSLSSRELGSKLQLLDARDALQQHIVSSVQLEGQLKEAQLSIVNIESEIEKTTSTFLADNSQKLSLAERQQDELENKLLKASTRLENLTLRAPVNGLIHGLTVTTIGQVIASGTELMRIVPDASNDIELECYLPNRDAGFVRSGQEASIKIDAYPFTRYGTIKARVVRVGGDSIPEPDAQMLEGNMATPKRQPNYFSGDRTQNLVFPVTLYIDTSSTGNDSVVNNLSVGMTVTAEIVTGRRSVMSYLLSSVLEVSSRALTER